METRKWRRSLGAALLGIGLGTGGPAAFAQTASDRRVDEAVSRGIDYLMASQAGNGSISNGRYVTAMTAWSVLAMAGAGHTPRDPTREAESMRAAIDFLLRSGRKWGNNWYFSDSTASGMYEHGMTTLALTELLTLKIDPLREPALRQLSQKAVDLIVSAQNGMGGWRYYPNSKDADLSVTIWQVMALRSAQEAKLKVPGRTIDQALNFVLSCYKLKPVPGGGVVASFGYMQGGPGTYANQVSGLRALQVCRQYNAPAAIDTANQLQSSRPGSEYFYYSTYYYAQAMQLHNADAAQEAYLSVEQMMLPAQRADGSWNGGGGGFGGGESGLGTIYATGMALISLEVRYHRLPMFKF